jgi:hypothetical protein
MGQGARGTSSSSRGHLRLGSSRESNPKKAMHATREQERMSGYRAGPKGGTGRRDGDVGSGPRSVEVSL